jgi:phosphomevalonate kinase
MAVERRLLLEANPSRILHIESSWPGSSAAQTGSSPVVEAAVEAVAERLGGPCTGSVRIDSSAFFSGGRKAGLGSSAAVCVALVCALLALAGRREEALGARGASLALAAHRRAQGGKGSGYDVLASFHGGCGLFRGGAAPDWTPCRLPAGMDILMFPGPAPVSTSDAVERYLQWKESQPDRARDFLQRSRAAVRSFAEADRLEDARAWFAACRDLGVDLGRSIGVSAEMEAPPGLDPRLCKAAGAGNELGFCLRVSGSAPPVVPPGCTVVPAAPGGVTWA